VNLITGHVKILFIIILFTNDRSDTLFTLIKQQFITCLFFLFLLLLLPCVSVVLSLHLSSVSLVFNWYHTHISILPITVIYIS